MTDQKALDGALLKGATTIEQSQSDIESTLKNLESKLSGIGSSWQGEAAVAFQNVMAEWQTEAGKVTSALTELHTALRSSDSASQANEAEQSAALNKYKVRYSP